MASIPRANAPISNSDGSPTREWYNYLRANLSPSDLTTVEGEITVIAEKLGSPDGRVQNIPPISAGGTIVAQQSIAAAGSFPGAVILNLVNDQASPGNTYFYGTSPTGSKGWVSLTTALDQASIGNLGDVDTTTTAPTDGQVLTWVNADSKWERRTPTGGSLPPGGTIGQVLTKLSATDGDADWEDPTGGVESIVPGAGIAVDSTDPANPVISSTLGSIALSGYPATYSALPTGLGSGDAGKAYMVKADGLVYIWNGSAFPASGSGIRVGGAALIGSTVVSGPAVTSMTVSGLNLDADSAYWIEINVKSVSGATRTYLLTYNSDTTATNYPTEILFASAGSLNASLQNAVIGGCYAGSTTRTTGDLGRDADGYPCFLFRNARKNGAATVFQSGAHMWTTSANVTSITVTGEIANIIGPGSSLKVYRR